MKSDQDQSKTGRKSIGTCWIDEDGTIHLSMVATSGDGVRGYGNLSYAPDHERYQEILDHIGPIKPGEKKPVAPWPD